MANPMDRVQPWLPAPCTWTKSGSRGPIRSSDDRRAAECDDWREEGGGGGGGGVVGKESAASWHMNAWLPGHRLETSNLKQSDNY